MIKPERTITIGDIIRIGTFLVMAGVLFARTEERISMITKEISELRNVLVENSNEIKNLRIDLIETRAAFRAHNEIQERMLNAGKK